VRKFYTALVGLALGAVAVPNYAEENESRDSGFLIGSSYFMGSAKADGFSIDVNSLSVFAGYQFNQSFSMELHKFLGSASDTVQDSIVDLKAEISGVSTLYGKFVIPNQSGFKPYGRIGYTSATGSVQATGFNQAPYRPPGCDFCPTVSLDSSKDTRSENGLAFGIGVEYHASESFRLLFAYDQLVSGSDVEISGLSVGIAGKF